MMAAADFVTIDIEGVGGHAARPHLGIDTVLVGAQIVNNIQSIVSRNVDPLKSAVVSICMFQAGNTDNVIPQTAQLRGTARSLTPEVRDLLEKRLHEVVEGTAAAYGAKAKLTYRRNYPVLVNHERADRLRGLGRGRDRRRATRSTPTLPPMMGAEDFSFMLNARPGAFIWVGNGDSAGLHHPAYNFNDDVIPFGTSYWVKLVRPRWRGVRLRGSAAPMLRCASATVRTAAVRRRRRRRRRARRQARRARVSSVAPGGEVVEPRALDHREADRREERQALHQQHDGEDVDLAHFLDVGRDQHDRAEDQQARQHRFPEGVEIASCGAGRPWRCARTADDP